MPKRISQKELTVIIDALAGFPEGAGVDKISDALKHSIPRRTLQRWLALLVSQERLTVEGSGRASCYLLPDTTANKLSTKKTSYDGTNISLSPEGEILRQRVSEPIQNRQPAGYNKDFLDSYQPNETFFLSSDIRKQLHEIGRVQEEQHQAGTYARRILNRLLIDLSWNSSRLEGNTYSLLETERLLEFGEAAEGKNAQDAQMLLNHKDAIELLVEQATEVGFSRYTILNLHGLLSDNLLADAQACGRLRAIPVGIGGSVYHPLEIPQMIEECFDKILATAQAIEDPFEQTFFVMVHLPYLQPFEDVNKRVSRLAANIPMICQNLCPLSFADVPEQAYIDGIVVVYELNRVELLRDIFVWAYQRSCARYSAIRQSLGEPDPFRMKYREEIRALVTKVVCDRMDKRTAVEWISTQAIEISDADRQRFIEIIETELGWLHEGNIARYRLLQKDFSIWKKNWS